MKNCYENGISYEISYEKSHVMNHGIGWLMFHVMNEFSYEKSHTKKLIWKNSYEKCHMKPISYETMEITIRRYYTRALGLVLHEKHTADHGPASQAQTCRRDLALKAKGATCVKSFQCSHASKPLGASQ